MYLDGTLPTIKGVGSGFAFSLVTLSRHMVQMHIADRDLIDILCSGTADYEMLHLCTDYHNPAKSILVEALAAYPESESAIEFSLEE